MLRWTIAAVKASSRAPARAAIRRYHAGAASSESLGTAEIQPRDALSGVRLRQLLADLRRRVIEAVPRAAVVLLTPALALGKQPEPTPWDRDYWLQRLPDHEQA